MTRTHLALALLLCVAALPANAEDKAAAPAPATPTAAAPAAATPQAATPAADAAAKDKEAELVLTPEEKAEKESRKSCKINLCAAFRVKKAEGGDIACNVVKSWRKEQMNKLVSKLKVSWPYGAMKCTAPVTIKRADILKAMTEPKFEMQLDKHAVHCVIDKEQADKADTDIKFEFSPKVNFENGKAVKAKMNWGKIEAPALFKGAMWTATGADNTVNLLSSTLVEDINDFVTKKCDEVKDDWAAK